MAIATWRYKRGIEQFVSEHKRNPTLDELISRNSGPLWLEKQTITFDLCPETVAFDWTSRSSRTPETLQTITGGTDSHSSYSNTKSCDACHILQTVDDVRSPMASGSARTNNDAQNMIPPAPKGYGKGPHPNDEAASRAEARGRSLWNVMHSEEYTIVDDGSHSTMAGQDFFSCHRQEIHVPRDPQNFDLEEMPAIFKNALDPMKNPRHWIPDGAMALTYPDSTLAEMRLECIEAVTQCNTVKIHEISLRMAAAKTGAEQSRRRDFLRGNYHGKHGRPVRVHSPEPFCEYSDEVEWIEIYSDEDDAEPDSIPKCRSCNQHFPTHREDQCNFFMRGKIPNELDKCVNCGMDPPNHFGGQCVFERNTFDLRTCQLELFIHRLHYQMSLLKKNNQMLHDKIYQMQMANLPKAPPAKMPPAKLRVVIQEPEQGSSSTSADAPASSQIHSNPLSFPIGDGLDLESTDEDTGPDTRCALAKSSDPWRKCHKADRLQRWKDMIIMMKRRLRNNRVFTYAMNKSKSDKFKGITGTWTGYSFFGVVTRLTKESKWNNLQAKFMINNDPTIQAKENELDDPQIRNYRRKNALEIQKLVRDNKVRINSDATPPLLELITADNRRFQWPADRFTRRTGIPQQTAEWA